EPLPWLPQRICKFPSSACGHERSLIPRCNPTQVGPIDGPGTNRKFIEHCGNTPPRLLLRPPYRAAEPSLQEWFIAGLGLPIVAIFASLFAFYLVTAALL